MEKLILDACCGSRMMWFDKQNPIALFADIRQEEHTLCDQRKLVIKPDVLQDFTNMQFPDNHFKGVAFDPPHIDNLGPNSYMALKYGRLGKTWREDIRDGLNECMRVVDVYGFVVMKWNETRITLNELLSCLDHKPLFGHTSGRQSKTIWMIFMKLPKPPTNE